MSGFQEIKSGSIQKPEPPQFPISFCKINLIFLLIFILTGKITYFRANRNLSLGFLFF